MAQASTNSSSALLRAFLAWGIGVIVVAASLAPLLRPQWFTEPAVHGIAMILSRTIAMILVPVAAWLVLRRAFGSRRETWIMVAIAVLAAGFCEQVHHQFVDRGSYFGGGFVNATFQANLQRDVLALNPAVIPHSYRFLSHSLIAWMEWLTGSYDFGKTLFRLIANTLLVAITLRYARLYLTSIGAAAVVLVLLMIYPITIAWYAGQPVDPLSHLSFVACLYFLSTRQEGPFLPTLLVGLLAKESVAVMAIARLFHGRSRLRAGLLAAFYLVVAVVVLGVVRYFVNGGTFSYDRISGVGPAHLLANLKGIHEWAPQYLFSVGILIPGAILGWRLMDIPFRRTCAFLTAALIGSSLLFSWLNEVRNLVPALIMLLIVNIRYLESRLRVPGRRDEPNGFASV